MKTVLFALYDFIGDFHFLMNFYFSVFALTVLAVALAVCIFKHSDRPALYTYIGVMSLMAANYLSSGLEWKFYCLAMYGHVL